jgi:hypothetical protein
VRPTPEATVSAPIAWSELEACDPRDFTLATIPARFAAIGDPHRTIDDRPASLEALMAWVARDERDGEGDAPWPPHYRKAKGEPPRVQPSKRRTGALSAARPAGGGRRPPA